MPTTDPGIQTQLEHARAALQQKRYWQAVPALEAVIRADPSHAEAFELLGIAHTLTGDSRSARRAFRSATEADPGRATAHYNYALYLFEANEIDEAAEENNTALFISPSHAGANILQRQIREKLRFRDYTCDEAQEVALVGRASGAPSIPSGEWKKLQCPYCNAMNFVTAKVCEKCNMLIPEMDEIVPVE